LSAILDKGCTVPETCEVLTGRSFTAVRLPDGAIGTAMDYSWYGPDEVARSPELSSHPTTRLLEGAWEDSGTGNLRAAAVFMALLGALSRPFYQVNRVRQDGFHMSRCSYAEQRCRPMGTETRRLLAKSLNGSRSVGVVGFGGFMEMYAEIECVDRILVCDRDLEWRSERVRATVRRLNQGYGREKITLIGNDLKRLRRECEVVQITASALCNNTMDELLEALDDRPLVVVGPSGAVLPEWWIEIGATLICTELRNPDYWWAYQFDDHLYEWFSEYDDRIYIW